MTNRDDEYPPRYTPRPSGRVANMPSRPLPTRDEDAGKGQTELMNAREALVIKALKGSHAILDALASRALDGEITDPAVENARTSAAKAYLSVAMAPPRAEQADTGGDAMAELAAELRAARVEREGGSE